jgi:hypothetical protein
VPRLSIAVGRKMLRQLAALWLAVTIATCSSGHKRKTSSYLKRADSELIIDTGDKTYTSHTKLLHPG